MHGRTLLLSLALAAALAPAAGAAAPMAGETYEGPGPVKGGGVRLEVSANGARVKFLSFAFERGCRVRGRRLKQQSYPFLRNLRIRKGRFAYRRSIRYPSTGGHLKTTLKGRFVAGGRRFVGTVRERVANPQNGVRCDSGRVRFGGAVAERVLINGDWTGQTAQGRPIALTITEDGLAAVSVEVTLTCRNGEQITRSMAPFERPGYIDDGDLSFRGGSSVGEGEVSIAGTASRTAVEGVVTATDSIDRVDEAGDTRSYWCESGEVPFEATRN